MTDRPPATGHQRWAELAVGHAFDALDPEDQAAFRAHLAGCATCAVLVAETARTAADLAELVPAAVPPAGLRERILDAAAGPAPVRHRSPAVPGPRASAAAPWWRRPAALALAACVVLAAAVALTVSVRRGGSSPTDVAARCARVGCPTAELSAGGRTVARVLLLGGSAYVQPVGLAPNRRGRDEYVLWRMDPRSKPVAVGGFDVTAGTGPVEVGRLGVPADQVRVVALSVEPGTSPPPVPSRAIASGAFG